MRAGSCAVFLLLLAAVGEAGTDEAAWQALAPLPVARHDLQLVAWKDRLIAISGAHDETVADVDAYDPVRNAWTALAPIPDRRGWFGAALLGGRIYCVGGKLVRTEAEKNESGNKGAHEYRASLNVYDPEANRWTVAAPMDAPRAGCGVAVLDGKLYVIGGSNPADTFQRRVEIYDPAKNAWQDGPPLPDGREDLSAAAVGGKVYAIGGVNHSVRADVYILDPVAGKWASGAPMPTPRRSFALAVDGPRLWCVGGVPTRGGYTAVVDVYDTRSDTWTAGPSLPQAKAWAGADVLGGRLYVVGGANSDPAGARYDWLGEAHALALAPAAGARAREEIAVTWWGNMAVEVNFGDVNLVFDPYVKPDAPRFHYIFVSHNHYDHGHEPTLRALIRPDSPFEMLFAPRGSFYASRLDGPSNFSDTPLADLDFVPREKAVAMYPKYNDTVGPHVRKGEMFGGPTEIVTGRIRVEAFRSHEDPAPLGPDRNGGRPAPGGSYPNLGFLVTDLGTGRSVAHTGDIWNAYPEMARMRGKVDVLFYPLAKLSVAERKKMMDYIQPRVAVPTHYRLFEPDFPIPALFPQDVKDTDLYKDEAALRKACLGHWYPSPADPAAAMAADREAFKGLTRVVELKAGTRYVLPADLAGFKGREGGR